MSANETAEDGEQATLADGDVFEPSAIRGRLPNALTDKQVRAMVAAIRNPDASITEIAEATNVKARQISHALDSIACGVLGADDRSGEWLSRRDGPREAETFSELTDKQKAVVDYLARSPNFGWAERSSRELLAAIENDDESDYTSGFSAHYTYPKRVAADYRELVHERRAFLVEHESLELDDDGDVSVDASDLRPGDYTVPRILLERAGYALPDRNLDSLDAVDPDDLTEDERLELAFENGQERREGDDETVGEVRPDKYLGPLSCPRCGTEARGKLACPDCGALKVHDDAVTVENRVEDDLDLADIRRDVLYEGFVNAVEDYGVFVTIAGRPREEDDVSGLLHVSDLPHDDVRRRYATGEVVYVVVPGVHDADSNAANVAWPTEDYLKSASGHVVSRDDESDESAVESEVEGETPEDTDEADERDVAAESDTSDEPDLAYAEFDDLRERVAALEHELAGVDERRVEDIESRLDDLASVLPTETEIAELNEAAATVSRAEAQVADLGDRLDALDERLSVVERQLDDDLAPIEAFENLDRRVGELENGANDQPDDLAAAIETLRASGIGVELTINPNE